MKVYINKWLIMMFFSIVSMTMLSAQGLTQNDLVKTPEELIDANLNGDGNEAYLTQIGNKNEVSVIQDLQGANATNLVKVLQVGNRNKTAVNQLGQQNQTIVIQNGYKNNYTLNLDGSDNTFVIKQEGKRNTINQNLTNTTATHIELIQQGNDNEITHTQDGLTNQKIIVKQIGNNLKMQVNQTSNN